MQPLLALSRFDLDDNPQSQGTRWEKWLARFENFILGLNVKEVKRKKALLLHYAGDSVYDIYSALPSTVEGGTASETYYEAKAKLLSYLRPKTNTQYAIYQFRATTQLARETLDAYYARLRIAARDWQFPDTDREIFSQIVQSCSSTLLRRRALRDTDMKLVDLLNMGRALETSEAQAGSMEMQECTARLYNR